MGSITLAITCGGGWKRKEEDATSHSLNTHMLVHFGEKPHKCTQCNKSFNVASSLQTHVVVHIRGSHNSAHNVKTHSMKYLFLRLTCWYTVAEIHAANGHITCRGGGSDSWPSPMGLLGRTSSETRTTKYLDNVIVSETLSFSMFFVLSFLCVLSFSSF